MRGPEEVIVVVRRGPELLVLRRTPERLGYWSVAAGGVEPGETPVVAARRELAEETGLVADLVELPVSLTYSLLEDPPEVRARYAQGIETVTVHPFLAEAPRGWEPVLDSEHDQWRWYTEEDALALLAYEAPREAVRAAARVPSQ